MKEYKLIKEYPGSQNLGTLAYKSSISICYEDGDDILYSSSASNPQYFEDMIENQPEFWEEVIEKDYEILMLHLSKNINPYKIITSSQDMCHERIKNGQTIHSIKRLSDGEVFTIGDLFDAGLANLVIKSFKINTTKGIHIIPHTYGGFINLSQLKKPKQLLFTTEDGVDVFEGDRYWGMIKDNRFNLLGPFYNGEYTSDKCIQFSTKEKAEEYILMNKPCLSIMDIVRCGYSSGANNKSKNSRNIVKLVKSRL